MQTENQVAVQDELAQKALAIKAEAQERALALKELGIDTKDIVIPSVQLMQGTSALVGDGKAKLADIVSMQNEEVIGGVDKAVKILPLRMFKTLRTYDVTNNGFKFLREDVLTDENEKTAGEGTENGMLVKRYPTFNFFVLLKTDLDKGKGFPSLIRFRSTGMTAGRALATHLVKLVWFRQKPYAQFVELTVKKEKKDTATYAVFGISAKGEEATQTDVESAESWLAMLAAGNYKVAEADESRDEGSRVAAAKPVTVGGVIEEGVDY